MAITEIGKGKEHNQLTLISTYKKQRTACLANRFVCLLHKNLYFLFLVANIHLRYRSFINIVLKLERFACVTPFQAGFPGSWPALPKQVTRAASVYTLSTALHKAPSRTHTMMLGSANTNCLKTNTQMMINLTSVPENHTQTCFYKPAEPSNKETWEHQLIFNELFQVEAICCFYLKGFDSIQFHN